MKGFVKRRPVSEELARALKTADPQMGKILADNLQGGLAAIALTLSLIHIWLFPIIPLM